MCRHSRVSLLGGLMLAGAWACSSGQTSIKAGGADAAVEAAAEVDATGSDAAAADATGSDGPVITISWGSANKQPAGWYATPEASALADNIIYYQNDDGGWPKNVDMTTRTAPKSHSTIDNSATTTELIFLSLVYGATQNPAQLAAFDKGVDYLLAAQYPANGGWPQVYPSPTVDYQKHITYNDGAMIHVMSLLGDIGDKANHPQYAFVDDARAARCAAAVALGIQCILDTQIVVNGVKTGWCAQHDEVTLAPANARAYELAGESGSEGEGILLYLMKIAQPTPEIVDAVQGATAWFNKVQITGIEVQNVVDATQPSGMDTIVVADATAPPIWARFYDIGTDVPFFCGRDGIKKYSLAEIENERRTGYAWYGNWPASALQYYAMTWQPAFAPGANVLQPAPAP